MFPKTGLALMGSHGIALSLDLTNFVVRRCRGAVRRLSLADSLEFGNMGIWKSRNLEIWKSRNLEIWASGIQKKPKKWKLSECKSVLPKMFAWSGLVGNKTSRPHVGPFHSNFSMDRKTCKNGVSFHLLSFVVQWAPFTRFGVMSWCHGNL